MSKSAAGPIELLLLLIDTAFNAASWHGPNLRGAIRRVDAKQALWRPGPKRRNIAEITLHAAYWKYTAWRRIAGAKRGSFARKGSNWFDVNALSPDGWRDIARILDNEHARLREAITTMQPGRLAEVTPGARVDLRRVIAGVAMHDVYHAGQIQTIKRLMP